MDTLQRGLAEARRMVREGFPESACMELDKLIGQTSSDLCSGCIRVSTKTCAARVDGLASEAQAHLNQYDFDNTFGESTHVQVSVLHFPVCSQPRATNGRFRKRTWDEPKAPLARNQYGQFRALTVHEKLAQVV